MKKTRKVLMIILIAVFLLIVVFSTGAFAAETPKFVISSATADPGATVSITISIVNNPGVASARLFVSFDSSLTLESITYGENIGGMTQLPQKYTSPVVLNWISAFVELKTDEIYATLVFRVSNDATGGNHPITLKYDEDDVYNFKEDNVYFGIENGGIFVIREAEPTTASTSEPTTASTAEATTATVAVTTASTTEATTVATTAETVPTQTQATYPIATTAGTAQATTSTQQVISTAQSTTAETRSSESTAASIFSETTSTSRTEPAQTASTGSSSTSTVPSESVAETTGTVETKPSEYVVPTPQPDEKSSATVPIVVVACIAALFIVAFAVYVIKNKKIG